MGSKNTTLKAHLSSGQHGNIVSPLNAVSFKIRLDLQQSSAFHRHGYINTENDLFTRNDYSKRRHTPAMNLFLIPKYRQGRDPSAFISVFTMDFIQKRRLDKEEHSHPLTPHQRGLDGKA